MPFTFSHPAIVIPIKNKLGKYFDFTALVLGSMAPDFEYFLRFKPMGTIGHTIGGFFYFNLPLCFIIAYIFHYIVKKPFIFNLPKPIDGWFYHIAVNSWSIKSVKGFFVFVYSAIIGMFSHVLWDGFTHDGGMFVNRIPLLRKYIYFINNQIPMYKFFQHGSTLIGFMIIFLYLYRNRNQYKGKNYHTSTKTKLFYYACILFITVVSSSYRIFWILGGFNLRYIGSYIVTLINGGLIGVIIASLIFRIYFLVKSKYDL
ncbi:DUF4184 family protein [Crassaminicella indica]|uniref:DUF4184 family protein n=1 Tax=Crassaminicella indica TaxID=2855394 RepID=A0ABX8RFC0_9CLOT|nr:DUF4184 family protein [Crassaminicella indica]QXM07012.1 DUF4184 family protein [Crassaminicella indica]